MKIIDILKMIFSKPKHCQFIGKELVCLYLEDWEELENFYLNPTY